MLFKYNTSELISWVPNSISQHPLYLCVPPPPVNGHVGVASAQLWPPPLGQVHTSASAHIFNLQIVALMVARPTPGLPFGLIISVLCL